MLNRNALKWDEMVRRHFFSGSNELWGIDKVSTHVLGHLEWKLVETFAVTMNCPLNGTFIVLWSIADDKRAVSLEYQNEKRVCIFQF